MTEEIPDELFGFVELSAVTGMSTSTLSTLLHRSRSHRKIGKFIANDIPEPDTYLGASPIWLKSTVEKWLDARANGPSSVRVRRAVDPVESIKRGRAVPLDQKPESTHEKSRENPEVEDVKPKKERIGSYVLNRLKTKAKEARNRSINTTEDNDHA